MTTAVIIDVKQAELLLSKRPDVPHVISYCPNASYRLRKAGLNVTDSSGLYGVWSHARTAVAVHHDFARVSQMAAQQYGLSEQELICLQGLMHQYLNCVYHYYYSLRRLKHEGPFVWMENDTARQGDYASLFAALCDVSARHIINYGSHNYTQAHRLLALLYNRITAYVARRDTRVRVINYGDSLPDRIIVGLRDAGAKVLNAHPYKLRNAYKTTGFFLKSLVRMLRQSDDTIYMFRAPTKYVKKHVPEFRAPKMIAPEVEAATRAIMQLYAPFVCNEVLAGTEMVRLLRPRIAVSDHATYPFVVSGLDELGRQGGLHAMLNHSTHTVQHTPISKMAADDWMAQQRVINRNTTHSLPKSPLTEALVRQVRPEGGYKTGKVNVYDMYPREQRNDGPFVLLHAGNFTNAKDHIAWCKETGHEYLLGMIELLDEIANIDNVELIIKLKNKKTGNYKVMLEEHIARLGIGHKAKVDTVGFTQHVRRAHMVVCNLSATIEQSLANHLPVMLHSYRKNYFHIDEKILADSQVNGLAPAYLVKERADIARIVAQLTHRREELRDPALYANVAWKQNALTSMQDFAKDLLH